MASTVNLPNLVPQFPAEIWGIVFSNLDPTDQELVHLWLDYRFVSKLFKEEIEHLFAKKIIQKTSLLIGSGRSLYIHRSRSSMHISLTLTQGRLKFTETAPRGRSSVYHGGTVCHTAAVSRSRNSPSSAIEPSSAVTAPRTVTPAISSRP